MRPTAVNTGAGVGGGWGGGEIPTEPESVETFLQLTVTSRLLPED